jgi:hypothetical protein
VEWAVIGKLLIIGGDTQKKWEGSALFSVCWNYVGEKTIQ